MLLVRSYSRTELRDGELHEYKEVEMSEEDLKFGYIAYGKMKPEFLQISPEDRKKEMDRLKEKAEKQGFKIMYWGHPYGVSENIVVVYKSDKTLEDYFNMGIELPYNDTRTNLIVIP